MSPVDDNTPDAPEEVAPVAVLNDFEEDVSPEFVPRLRRRLHRRIFTGQVTQFTFNVPGMLVLEFLRMIFGFLPARGSRGATSESGTRKEDRP